VCKRSWPPPTGFTINYAERIFTNKTRQNGSLTSPLNDPAALLPFDPSNSASIACVAVCCSVLQCDAECCSVLQCVAVCCIHNLTHVDCLCTVAQQPMVRQGKNTPHLYPHTLLFAPSLTHTRTHSHEHTRSFPSTHTHTDLCTHFDTHTHLLSLSHTRTHALSLTHQLIFILTHYSSHPPCTSHAYVHVQHTHGIIVK